MDVLSFFITFALLAASVAAVVGFAWAAGKIQNRRQNRAGGEHRADAAENRTTEWFSGKE